MSPDVRAIIAGGVVSISILTTLFGCLVITTRLFGVNILTLLGSAIGALVVGLLLLPWAFSFPLR